MKYHRILSYFLSVILLFVGVHSTAPITAVAATYTQDETDKANMVGYIRDSSGNPVYEYYIEQEKQTYDASDPEQLLLFDFGSMQASGSQVTVNNRIYFSDVKTDDGTGGGKNVSQVVVYNGANNTNDMTNSVAYYTDTNSSNPNAAGYAQEWGLDTVIGVGLKDTDGNGLANSVNNTGNGNKFFFNIQIDLGKKLDLTKFTHIMLPVAIERDSSDALGLGTDCILNFVLADSASGHTVDGFERDYQLNRSQPVFDAANGASWLRMHYVTFDIRGIQPTLGLNNKPYLNQIDHIAIRCYSNGNEQYNTGSTPRFYFGRCWAYTEHDTMEFDTIYVDSNGDSDGRAAYEPQQATFATIKGQHAWNQDVEVTIPMWEDSPRTFIANLDYGDTNSEIADYYTKMLNTWSWRWLPQNTNSNNYKDYVNGRSFPNQPGSYLTGGGGAWGLSTTLKVKTYLTANAHASYYFK